MCLDGINTLPAFVLLRLSQIPIELTPGQCTWLPSCINLTPGVMLQQRFTDIPERSRCPNG